jgi:hypothetical protein
MTADTTQEHIFLLDDPDLFREITKLCSPKGGKVPIPGFSATPLPSGGTGFTKSRRFQIGGKVINFLLLSPKNAQPFAYLTIGQRTLKHNVPLVVAIAGARTLDRTLYPGDIALVSEAVALPYPALYTNAPAVKNNPAKPQDNKAEVYQADAATVATFLEHATVALLPQIWQKNLTAIRTGYAKHPTLRGGLEPWAPEQYDMLKDAGISTISETPAGVYEVQHLCPNTQIICFNMIKGAPGPGGHDEWMRRKKTLMFPAIKLMIDIISSSPTRPIDTKSA